MLHYYQGRLVVLQTDAEWHWNQCYAAAGFDVEAKQMIQHWISRFCESQRGILKKQIKCVDRNLNVRILSFDARSCNIKIRHSFISMNHYHYIETVVKDDAYLRHQPYSVGCQIATTWVAMEPFSCLLQERGFFSSCRF